MQPPAYIGAAGCSAPNGLASYGGYPQQPAFSGSYGYGSPAPALSYTAGAPAYSGTYPAGGLASYGHSASSEAIDLNSLPPFTGYSPYGQQMMDPSQCCNYSTLDINDPQLNQQVEQIVASLYECKRPMLRRQVVTVPASCPGRVLNITRRLPTPPPDIVERITVVKPPRDVVNLCIEKPCQPGPCFQQRQICGNFFFFISYLLLIFFFMNFLWQIQLNRYQ
jgi:hypothetical protein